MLSKAEEGVTPPYTEYEQAKESQPSAENSDILERYTDDEKKMLEHEQHFRASPEQAHNFQNRAEDVDDRLYEKDIHDPETGYEEPNDTDGEGPHHADEFDWDVVDDEDSVLEDEQDKITTSKIGNSALFKCLQSNSSSISWILNIILGLILIGVAVIIHVIYDDLRRDPTQADLPVIAIHLELWFTWFAFMWVISVCMHFLVEVVPWGIKTFTKVLMPTTTEITRMRLAYYHALKTQIKLILICAWGWGAWAFLRRVPTNLYVSPWSSTFDYTRTLQIIWECCFFLALMVFIEKFILQLIVKIDKPNSRLTVTAFHRKAYSIRIAHNDYALTVLDKLKKVRRKVNYGRGRKNKSTFNTGSARPSFDSSKHRDSNSGDDIGTMAMSDKRKTQSVPGSRDEPKSNVHFSNSDTRIPIPDDKSPTSKSEQRLNNDGENDFTEKRPDFHSRGSSDFFAAVSHKLKRVKANQDQGAQHTSRRPQIKRLSSRSSTLDSAKTLVHGGKDTALAIPNLIKSGFNIKSVYSTILPPSGTSQEQAKALAKQIFSNLLPAGTDRPYLVEADFYNYFRTKEDATKAFALFDKDGNGDVSKRELRNGCIRIYKERKLLSASMRDLSQASGKLDMILLTIAVVIWAVIVCACFGINVGTSLMPLWTMFVAVSFIFGNSAKDMFESIIFIFVLHPYDIGDRVFIGTENWQVKSMGLLMTTFLKWDGTIVYVKNSVLAPLYILNVSRAGAMGETIDIHLHFRTPAWKIDAIRDQMTEWCNTEGKGLTYGSHGMNIVTYDQLNKITCTIYIEHKQNWADGGKRWASRNAYMIKLKEVLETLEVNYVLPPMPVTTRNDAPDELYNFGSKTGYGTEGLASVNSSDSALNYRRGYRYSEKGQSNMLDGGSSGGTAQSDPGPGPASALVFASQM